MKKLFALLLALAILFSFSACSNNDTDGGKADGPMAYTVQKCIYTTPAGYETVVYTAELSDTAFTMNNLVERMQGQVNRDSYIFEYDAGGITAIRQEEQDHGKDVEDEGTTTLTYDADTATLKRETVEDGKVTDQEIYNLVWDGEGRLSSYKRTSFYFEYDDAGAVTEDNKYEYNYTYAYGADAFTITCDQKANKRVNGDYRDVIRRLVTTVPYAEKADITTVESYVDLGGTTPVYVEEYDKTLEKEVTISNWWGYETSHVLYFTDGTTQKSDSKEVTFDDQGRVVKTVSETYVSNEAVKPEEDRATVTVIIDFTYDANGNLTEIKRTVGSDVSSYTFEWMQIPAKLDTQLAMYSGAPHWSVAEYIDNFVSFNWEGRLTVRTYKLEDFLNYVQ